MVMLFRPIIQQRQVVVIISDKLRKFDIRISEDDLNLIKDKAAKLGYTTSHYIRQMALNGYVVERNSEGLQRLIWEINKIGVNINQIVKFCNEYKAVPPEALRDLVAEHNSVWQLLDNFLATKGVFKTRWPQG